MQSLKQQYLSFLYSRGRNYNYVQCSPARQHNGGRTDGSSDEDFLSSGEYLHKPNIQFYKPLEPIPQSDAEGGMANGEMGGADNEDVYEEVINNPGPCTQSGD